MFDFICFLLIPLKPFIVNFYFWKMIVFKNWKYKDRFYVLLNGEDYLPLWVIGQPQLIKHQQTIKFFIEND